MKIDHTRAKSVLGLHTRVRSILLSFVFGCYHNSMVGRPILAIKGILV
jgi:hypothetical protein